MKTILENDNEFICDIKAPCFQMLSSEEVELVRSSRTQVLYRKGDNLCKQGAFASYVLFVINGLVKQYVEGDGNASYNLSIFKPGDFVGLSSVFQGRTIEYSTVALTDCQVFLVERDTLSEVMQQNAMFAYNMMRRYINQSANLYDSIRNLMFKQMNGRMAEVLLYLDGFKTDGVDVFPLLSRKDVADFAGISTESTVKLLKTFEKDGIIALEGKNINVINAEALKEISRVG